MTLSDCCRDLRRAEPLAQHTSFRTGGPARWFAQPENEGELTALLGYAEQHALPHIVIGRGTNLLAADSGYDGLVIRPTYGSISPAGDLLRAEAGLTLGRLYELALSAGFTGLEFAAGIPGTLGGAITMNAGAYGGEIKDVVHSVRWRLPGGEIRETAGGDLAFSYRESRFSRSGGTILSALLRLPRGSTEKSRALQEDLMRRRRERQPLDMPSAGSTFKRPPGAYAGALIEACGLRGARAGGAAVSKKHAGFVVNTGDATSADIHRLIREIQQTVAAQTGILLEPEVRYLGVFTDD